LYRTQVHPRRGLFLEGQVAKIGADLEWTIRIIDQKSVKTIWSQAFDQRSGQSALELQRHIADGVRARLALYQGTPPRTSTQSGPPTDQALAFDQYMRARFLLESPSPVSTRAALPYLEQA